jgi:hypothetical protein
VNFRIAEFRRGRPVLRALSRSSRALLATAAVFTVVLAAAAPAAACPGRQLLKCGEKNGVFGDLTRWTNAWILDAELFEAPQVHVYNPALAQFWRFETSTAAARSFYDALLFAEFVRDPDFEDIATPRPLPKPVVHRSGIIDRRTAAAMSSLMQAEQGEVVSLQALDTSLDRAQTAFFTRGRSDWGRWQLAAAGRYASRVAGAIGSEIHWQHVVTADLLKRNRPYGVGSTDLKLSQRQVRRHGFARGLAAVMQTLGLAGAMPALTHEFLAISFGFQSFNVTQVLSTADVISAERSFATSLRQFAARIPPASKPPS